MRQLSICTTCRIPKARSISKANLYQYKSSYWTDCPWSTTVYFVVIWEKIENDLFNVLTLQFNGQGERDIISEGCKFTVNNHSDQTETISLKCKQILQMKSFSLFIFLHPPEIIICSLPKISPYNQIKDANRKNKLTLPMEFY